MQKTSLLLFLFVTYLINLNVNDITVWLRLQAYSCESNTIIYFKSFVVKFSFSSFRFLTDFLLVIDSLFLNSISCLDARQWCVWSKPHEFLSSFLQEHLNNVKLLYIMSPQTVKFYNNLNMTKFLI